MDKMTLQPEKVKTAKSSSFFKPTIQKKLSVGSANDTYEVEADAMANKVMRMQEPQQQNVSHTGALVQRKCTACEQEEKLQKKPLAENITPLIQRSSTENSGESQASNHIENQINNSRGGGNSMDHGTKNFMESRFGADFSGVRIHTGSQAVQMSRELNAQAFTVGNDVYFNEGKYSPNTDSGKHLLAHELTHTVQQTGTIGRMKIQRSPSSDPSINAWQEKLSGSTSADNLCGLCPKNLGVNSITSGFQNGIELKAFILNDDTSHSYDIKRTKHGKVWIKSSGAWTNPINLGPGNDDDSHNRDEFLTSQITVPYLPYIYSMDAPGFNNRANPIANSSATEAILSGNFIEFVRVTRPNNTTYDDTRAFNWHSMIWIVKNVSGTWDVNASRSVIGTGHLPSLDP
ncbi:uncharacterized protein DUF4157 [Flavobacterium sp. 1]|uniref:eCIS core domain-containing protein n=1 Tax=Flavobacterium sp. 1 TaxID=2035200 RepID=UPI000CA9AEDE|nr:DUF4157 domain-containing protein [Flavobacterium sp. 1]PJJ10312.1 uncharacterized protein DUF4157 [Flavobacterium sp. 1]